MLKVKVKALNENAILPEYKTFYSAGADICSCERVTVPAHQTVMVHSGMSIEPSNECVVLLYARSGLATKHGLGLANGVGVVDWDYRGEVIIPIHNHSDEDYTIIPGERVAQMVLSPVIHAKFEYSDNLSATERGAGGFGSTGKL